MIRNDSKWIISNHLFQAKCLDFLILQHRYKICVVVLYYILKNPDFTKVLKVFSGIRKKEIGYSKNKILFVYFIF